MTAFSYIRADSIVQFHKIGTKFWIVVNIILIRNTKFFEIHNQQKTDSEISVLRECANHIPSAWTKDFWKTKKKL